MTVKDLEIVERLARLETSMDDMQPKVNAMYDLFMQARGFKIALIFVGMVIGGLATYVLTALSIFKTH